MDDDCEMNSVFAQRLIHQQRRRQLCLIHRDEGVQCLRENGANQSRPSVALRSRPKSSPSSSEERPGEHDENTDENIMTGNVISPRSFKLPSEDLGFQEEHAHSTKNDSLSHLGYPLDSIENGRLSIEPRKIISDRYIPLRSGDDWQIKFQMIPDNKPSTSKHRRSRDGCNNSNTLENSRDGVAYNCLLRNEILGASISGFRTQSDEKKTIPLEDKTSLFQYRSSTGPKMDIDSVSPYSLSSVSPYSQKLLRSPIKVTRKISRIPFKVLDAPELQDDFYLNLVDWSSQNVLSVGLGSCVYLWSACTSQVTRLCDLSTDSDSVTSVSWNERGNLVAVGTHLGYVQVWDVASSKAVSKFDGHTARVGALAWSGDLLSSGSRDRMILQRDIRVGGLHHNPERKLSGHRQEVCGLKWSPDNLHLASGGNDNRLYVWNMHSSSPIQSYTEHLAAVKAIAWSPHHHGLLASGGGTADRCIRFWNTLTSQPMQCVDTGSQVCNLAWSKHSSELVSTHGYSQNQILVWKYPSLTQVAKLTGHSYRVLYLAMSPDGEAIVTGAGDETLRFWNVFSKVRSQKECKSVLNLFGNIR